MSTTVYREQRNNVRISDFRDAVTSSVFNGGSLTNLSLTGVLYDDTGTPSEWTIAGTLTYSSGTTWLLTITSTESNQTEAYGTLFISADEIEPYQLDIVLSDFVGEGIGGRMGQQLAFGFGFGF